MPTNLSLSKRALVSGVVIAFSLVLVITHATGGEALAIGVGLVILVLVHPIVVERVEQKRLPGWSIPLLGIVVALASIGTYFITKRIF